MAGPSRSTRGCLSLVLLVLTISWPAYADEHSIDTNRKRSGDRLVLDICRLTTSPDADRKVLGLEMAYQVSRTPSGHRDLHVMMSSRNPAEVKFAVSFLWCAADLCDVKELVHCAETHRADPAIVREAVSSIALLLDKLSLVVPQGEFLTGSDGILRLREWYNVHKSTWEGKSYVAYRSEDMGLAISRLIRDESDVAGDVFVQEWASFILTRNSTEAAPLIMSWLSQADPKEQSNVLLPELLKGLALYIGPLDIPEKDDVVCQEKVRRDLLVWWEKHKHETASHWLLNRLALRGYSTGEPRDMERTLRGLMLALKAEDRLEQQTAARALTLVLPDGDSIVVDDSVVVSVKNVGPTGIMAREYLQAIPQCKAFRWYLVAAGTCGWDDRAGTYKEKSPIAIAPQTCAPIRHTGNLRDKGNSKGSGVFVLNLCVKSILGLYHDD